MLNTFGTQFTAEVVVEADSLKGLARIELKRHNQPVAGECVITPTDGIELITEFRIECRDFQADETPLHYTVFQGDELIKWSASKDFNVTLLNTDDLRFAKGSVHIEDQLGSKTSVEIHISVRPYPGPLNDFKTIMDLMNQAKNLIRYCDYHRAWLILKIIVNAILKLPTGTDQTALTELAFDQMMRIELVHIHFARMAIQSAGPLLETQKTNSAIALKFSIIIRKSCNAMLHFYRDSPATINEQIILENINDTFALIDRVVQPFEPNLYVNSDYKVEIPVEYPFTEDYPEYEDFRPEFFYTLKDMLETSNNLYVALHDLSELYFQMKNPEENITVIEKGSMSFYSVAKDSGSIQLENTNTLVAVESPTINPISVSAAFFRSNPYWWYPEATKPNSGVLILFASDYPSRRSDTSAISLKNEESHTFHIFSNIKLGQEQVIHGMVAPSDDMPIYQLQVPANALLVIRFDDFCANLRVHLKPNSRPKNYELVKQHYIISNAANQLRWANNGSSLVKLFVAIAPDDPSAFSDSCDFSIIPSISVCRTWHANAWSTTHCALGPNTTEDRLHCVCTSSQIVFSAQLYMPPNHLDLPRDLLLSLHNNQVLIGLVVCLGMVFVSLMYWAWRRDRLDAKKNAIGYLHLINQPNPTHRYRITVATGIQAHAATTSHVYISIQGSNWAYNDMHLDQHCSPFRRGTEDNFLIRTEKAFGQIESVDVWIDCKGREPSWFCDWIRVRDLEQREDFLFLVGQWFSTVLGSNPQTRHSITLMTEADFHRKRNLFKLHFRHILTDRFMWYSIWMPFPRSPFTRKQRVLVAMASLTTSMMTNVMFFGQSTANNVEDENEQYSKVVVALRVLSIIGQSMLISLVLGFVLTFLFKWTSQRNDDGEERAKYRLMFREHNERASK